eukprot:gnl/TRDRNA2_/TRDRNA2_181110_c0_seq1.p1 gnl/TRDRNA2_/TRDRNA2_181110_c0~~gnl/TRDRNA2_/TRDRNA2_181110_c0_seq1.p1  ORF type:complete len:180 (+),score=63.87 gnl/TRDRNA2_/TRDRNA2_181110_c0_seq1:105-644(+)
MCSRDVCLLFVVLVSCAAGASARRVYTATSVSSFSELSASNLVHAAEELDGKELRFWPFTSWGSESAEEEKKPLLAAKPAAPKPSFKVADAKRALLASTAFKQKTAQLCQNVKISLASACEQAADDRLFCAMFSRHEEKFKGMDGEAEEKTKCSEIDIMETTAEAAKDVKEQQDQDFLH